MYIHQDLHSRGKTSEKLKLVYLSMPGSSREALKIGWEGLDAAGLQLG